LALHFGIDSLIPLFGLYKVAEQGWNDFSSVILMKVFAFSNIVMQVLKVLMADRSKEKNSYKPTPSQKKLLKRAKINFMTKKKARAENRRKLKIHLLIN
jgi:hypothetical protein